MKQDDADVFYIIDNIGHYDLEYTRSGSIKCAREKRRFSASPLTRTGECYLQPLESGRKLFALRGTPGAIGAAFA